MFLKWNQTFFSFFVKQFRSIPNHMTLSHQKVGIYWLKYPKMNYPTKNCIHKNIFAKLELVLHISTILMPSEKIKLLCIFVRSSGFSKYAIMMQLYVTHWINISGLIISHEILHWFILGNCFLNNSFHCQHFYFQFISHQVFFLSFYLCD